MRKITIGYLVATIIASVGVIAWSALAVDLPEQGQTSQASASAGQHLNH